VDASCEDIDVDENMSFLNTYVDNALAAGAAPYSPPQKDDDDDDIQNRQQKLLNTTPYATPTTPAATLTGLALSGIAGTYVYLKILEFYKRDEKSFHVEWCIRLTALIFFYHIHNTYIIHTYIIHTYIIHNTYVHKLCFLLYCSITLPA